MGDRRVAHWLSAWLSVMYAITLIQPYATCIVCWDKPVENRSWPLPAHLVGTRIAIHAGAKFDRESYEGVCFDFDFDASDPATLALARLSRAVIGTVLVIGGVRGNDSIFRESRPVSGDAAALAAWTGWHSRWFTNGHGHVYADPRPLKTPVPCKGALGYWRLPDDVAAAVISQGGAA